MNQTSAPDDLDSLVARIADEFLERVQRGDHPDPEEYAKRHPQAADVLRGVLPSLQLLEQSVQPNAGSSDSEPPLAGVLGDFRIIREVGRGGMGIVYEAEQISLGRRVALKVLPFAATMDPKRLQRFHNEARAAASLRHANIVPVHAVGSERGVHFYAMDFIDGSTLAQIIRTLHHPADSTPATADPDATLAAPGRDGASASTLEIARLSTEGGVRGREFFRSAARIGVQAAEALEHAHATGIVHRDIKPGNLMLDGTGNVWVTDFGLARFGADGDLTLSGDLLGTLRYMSPEQALARHGLVDHRTDVYGLGAALYEMLTGRPVVVGEDRQEILKQIAFEDPRPPRQINKLIPADLETILLKSLEKNPADRYATARDLADDLQHHLDDKPIQARRPTFLQHARKWSRRHQAMVWSVAASLVAIAAVTAGTVGWVVGDRRSRFNETKGIVVDILEQSKQLQGDGKYEEALAVAKRAAGVLAQGGGETDLRRQVQDRITDLKMVQRLHEIRLEESAVKNEHFDVDRADELYPAAFRDYGVNIEAPDVSAAAARIRSQTIPLELAAALDDWARVRGTGFSRRHSTSMSPRQLLALAKACDPDDRRSMLRDAMGDALEKHDFKRLKDMAASVRAEEMSPVSLGTIGYLLFDSGARDQGVALLREGQRQYPDDFWINHGLALTYEEMGPQYINEAIRYYSVALALRPKSPGVYLNFGMALHTKGDSDAAIAAFREAIRLKPDYADAYNKLGVMLNAKGQLDDAIAALREAIRLKPDRCDAYTNLGIALVGKGRYDAAVVASREAVRLKPDDADLHINLGAALAAKGQYDEALAEDREAVRLKPDSPEAQHNLGSSLLRKGRIDDSIAANREAVRLKPDDAEVHQGLACSLLTKGQLDDAIAECREAIRLNPKFAGAYEKLGELFQTKLQFDDAMAAYRKAIQINPNMAMAHSNLGGTLSEKGRLDEAIDELHEAIRLDPSVAAAHNNLGHALLLKGQLDRAIDECREAIRLAPDLATPYQNLGLAFLKKGQLDPAIAAFREAIGLKPDYVDPRVNLGLALAHKGLLDDAIATYREAIRLKPDEADAYINLVNALCRKGQFDDAITAARKAIRLKPEDEAAHLTLGNPLFLKQQFDEAISAYREAIRLKPDLADAHCMLGQALKEKGLFAEALIELRRGDELGSKQPGWPYPSAQSVREVEQLVALDGKLPAFVHGEYKPKTNVERLAMAKVAQAKKFNSAVVRLYSEAFANYARLGEDLESGNRYNGACAAALAGRGQGNDAASLDEKERARLRQQALDWLRADLAGWSKLLEGKPQQVAADLEKTLAHWQVDPDLAGVRGDSALAKLPESERAPWQKLWADVESLKKRAEPPAKSKPGATGKFMPPIPAWP